MDPFHCPSQIPGDDEVQQLQKALLDYLDEHNATDSALMVCSCVFFVNTLRYIVTDYNWCHSCSWVFKAACIPAL